MKIPRPSWANLRGSTLRTRLVATLLALAALGLIVSGVLVNNQLKSYLISRVDEQLTSAVGPMSHTLLSTNEYPVGPIGPMDTIPIGTYAALYDANGQLVSQAQIALTNSADPLRQRITTGNAYAAPNISPDLITSLSNGTAEFVTTSGNGSISSFRSILYRTDQQSIVVSMPLTDVNATLAQLRWLELAIGLAILALLGLGAYLLIRRELRPLTTMRDTAARIAGGDLSQRVDEQAGGSEVAELGRSLNTMLGQIEQSFIEKQQSQQRLRQFVSDASHELRTPLTSIRGYAEMFSRGAASSEADLAVVMRRIDSESVRMSSLVEQLLTLARLDEQPERTTERVDLAELVNDSVLDIRAGFNDHPISLTLADQTPIVQADPHAIQQVMSNLLANACRHTPAGTAIEVSLAQVADRVAVRVADHGPGVPDEFIDSAFDRFARADSARTRTVGGSGLGLSIVAALVSAHGGRYGYEPTAGGGATFWFDLPVSAGDRLDQSSIGLPSSTGTPTT